MKRYLVIITSLLLISVLLLSACGGIINQTPSPGTDAPDSKTLFNSTGLPIVNEPVTLEFLVRRSQNSKNDWIDKACMKTAVAETGINFDITEIQDAAWGDHVNIVLASGDLPDVLVGWVPNYALNLESFTPLNDLIEKYSPTMTKCFEDNPIIKETVIYPDGNIYSMPNIELNPLNSDRAWLVINQKWLNDYGLKIPETHDELYNVLKTFKEKDPMGNGSTIPFSFGSGSNYDLHYMLLNFGLYNDGGNGKYVMVENDKVLFVPTDPRYLEFLKYMNKLYSEDLIDHDAFIQTNAEFVAKGKTGVYGMFPSELAIDITTGLDLSWDYEYMLPTKDLNGNIMTIERVIPGSLSFDRYTVMKTCENPEVAILFWEYCNNDFYRKMTFLHGEENVTWKRVGNDMVELLSIDFPKEYETFIQARSTSALAATGFAYMSLQDTARIADTAVTRQRVLDRIALYSPHYKKGYIPTSQDTAEATKIKAEMLTEYQTYIQNFLAESIMKGIDEAKWQTHLDNCAKLKADEYVKLYQDHYDRTKKTN